jgi:hypothetical protein
MKKLEPYLGTAVTVIVVLVLLNIFKPMLPDSIARWL